MVYRMGELTCLRQGLEGTPPPCAADCRTGRGGRLGSWGRGRLPAMGELRSGWHISYQGDQQRGTPLTAPLMDKHTGRSVRLQGTGEAGTGPGGGVQRAAILNGLTPRAPRRRPGDPALVKDAGSR